MIRISQVWPVVIILSALAAGLVNFVLPYAPGRPIIVMWFLLVSPGMVLVRFFRLSEAITEWTLAIALSLAIDAVVAGIQLYAGRWSPSATLAIVIFFSIAGVIVQTVYFKNIS